MYYSIDGVQGITTFAEGKLSVLCKLPP